MFAGRITSAAFISLLLSIDAQVASMNSNQHFTTGWWDANHRSPAQTSDQYPSSVPDVIGHYSSLEYDQQPLYASQVPDYKYLTSPASPPTPGVWDIGNLDRLLQHDSTARLPDYHTDLFDVHSNEPLQAFAPPTMASRSTFNYFNFLPEELPISEGQDWSLEENMQGFDLFSSCSHKDGSSQKDDSGHDDAAQKIKTKLKKKRKSSIERYSDWTRSKGPAEVLPYLQPLWRFLDLVPK